VKGSLQDFADAKDQCTWVDSDTGERCTEKPVAGSPTKSECLEHRKLIHPDKQLHE
jgi:hypothetical protein